RIGRTELNPLGLGRSGIHWNAASSGSIPPRISKINRSFKSRNQPLIRIGGGSDDRRQRRTILDQSADIPERQLRKSGVTISGKQRLATFPERLVGMHSAAVVLKNRLKHEGHGLAILIGHILHDVLVEHHVVGGTDQG